MSLFFVISIIAVLGIYLIILHKMQKYVKYLFTFILLLILIVPNKVSAKSSLSEYTIENYNIDMVVNENNTEEYFVKTGPNIDKYPIAVIIFCSFCVLIANMLFAKYKKEGDKLIENVKFYPPEGYNSAEVGSLYYGSAHAMNITSLLIYLANKGYLKIEQIEEKIISKKIKEFKITKIKEYDGNNECEKLFFNGLFKNSIITFRFYANKAKEIMKDAEENGEKISFKQALNTAKSSKTISSKISITLSSLTNQFYHTLDKIIKILNSKENEQKIFETSVKGKNKFLNIMILAIFALLSIKAVFGLMSIEPISKFSYPEILIILLFLVLVIGIILLISSVNRIINHKISGIFDITWRIIFVFLPFLCLIALFILTHNILNLIMYIVGLISIWNLFEFTFKKPQRTPYGNEIFEKISEFKNFLEKAEKPQLERLVALNSNYFYDILPYAYSLGVLDIWISKFKTISLQAPNWYNSADSFNIQSFGDFITDAMLSALTTMSFKPKRYLN